jgi:hypothetical protein
MSIAETLKRQYGSCSAEEKLSILRSELRPHLTTIQSSAHALTRLYVEQRSDVPDDVREWIAHVAQAGATARSIVDALTDDEE